MAVDYTKLKAGDKVRYLGGDPADDSNLEQGRVYDVIVDDEHEEEVAIDLGNEVTWGVGDSYFNEHCFELVEYERDESDKPETTLDLIANLAQEVTELKSELKSIKEELSIQQENLRTWSIESTKMAYDLAELERKTDDHIDMFIEDISMLDERTQIKKEAKIEIDGRELVRNLLKEEGVYVR